MSNPSHGLDTKRSSLVFVCKNSRFLALETERYWCIPGRQSAREYEGVRYHTEMNMEARDALFVQTGISAMPAYLGSLNLRAHGRAVIPEQDVQMSKDSFEAVEYWLVMRPDRRPFLSNEFISYEWVTIAQFLDRVVETRTLAGLTLFSDRLKKLTGEDT